MTVLVDNIEQPPLTKICSKCQLELPVSDFYVRRTRDGYQAYCKWCNRKTAERARGVTRMRAADAKKVRSRLIQRAGGLCKDCGGVFPDRVYDFHHLDPRTKLFNLSGQGLLNTNYAGACTEADKCLLLCANCHRLRHSPL